MKWHFNSSDFTIKKLERRYWGLPWDVLETKNKQVILVTQNFFGWTVESLDMNTGNSIWKNARNQDFPDSTKKMFLIDNIYEREDGDIDVLGVKSVANDFLPFFSGNPIRAVYNINTGKEVQYFEPKQPTDSKVTIDRPGIARAYMKHENQYVLFSQIAGLKDSNLFVRRLDTNMVVLDTIAWYKNYSDNGLDKGNLEGGSSPYKIGNHFYYSFFLWNGKPDTSSFYHSMVKVKMDGTKIFEKNISKDLFYTADYLSYKPIQDGLLIAALVDTNFVKINNHSKHSKTSIIVKIDTSGTVVWTSKLINLTNKAFNVIAISEDIKRNGYWAYVGSEETKKTYLYFINKNGKSKLISTVTMDDNSEEFFASNLWVLSSGDLISAFRYQKCDNDSKFIYCWGVGLIEGSKLDKLLTINENTIEQIIDYELFPNPSNEQITLKLDIALSGKVNIINGLGQVVFSKSILNETVFNIETSQLPNGIYYINIVTKDNQSNRKFIIQH